jgi:hypothetical protein
MNDRSKAEAFRIRKMLTKRIDEGKAQQIGRGRYREIKR